MATYINGKLYWRSRTPVRQATVHRFTPQASRIGSASTAKGRQAERMYDRSFRDQSTVLEPGMVIIYERKPYRVLEIRERPLDLWDDRYEQAFDGALRDWDRFQRGPRPEKETWRGRPVHIVIQPAGSDGPERFSLTAPADHRWDLLPEHYALCVACGELPPCSHEIQQDLIQRQMRHAEEIMSIPAGHCLGCGEAITARMKTVSFPGPNLWRPDLPDGSAVFHHRKECSGDVQRYREQWQARGHVEAQLTLPGSGEA
ncbi:hypothetical protein [Streptomyces sp. NPDC017529]|uniref:hypothetical protein n=1 Tax=Streptomyces sp. NPDC017529 TaxID=3365000 RepID=UPI0037A14C80